MPIRLNLLAEAQAAEDLRRRDPVKRVLWAAALIVCLMLVWSSSLQLKTMIASREVAKAENLMKDNTNEFHQVIQNQRKMEDFRHKLAALEQLTTNRFLHANTLNALQQTFVEDVQLIHFRAEQNYAFTDEIKAKTNDNRVVPGKPATSTEKIVVSLEGSDSSANPGDQVLKYKEAVATNSWFRQMTGKPNAVALKTLSPPDMGPSGRRSVFFTLECRLPEITR